MNLIPIQVECHDGYKADEYPRKFKRDHTEFEIMEILDRWYEGYAESDPQTVHYFRVKADLKGSFLLKHEIENDRWFVMV